MIHVTCGHEKGIGLEVYIKSLLTNPKFSENSILHINESLLKNYLNEYKIEFKIEEDLLILNGYLKLECHFIENNMNPTMDSLSSALVAIDKEDILLTLPTSKDQIIYNEKQFNGYTEFFRSYYENDKILMSFIGPNENLVLLTDHLPISEIGKRLTPKSIKEGVARASNFFSSIGKLNKTYLLGVNPHAGEGGLLGNDEYLFSQIEKDENTLGPIPADTINMRDLQKNDLIVSTYHDQGLSFFKTKYKTLGINTTIGLHFKRVSLDHGTAFELFGQNLANYSGCQFLLNEIHSW